MSATTVSLPALPVIYAVDIYAAQGFRLADAAPEVRDAIVARADFFEAHGVSRKVRLFVVNPRNGIIEGALEVFA